MLESIIKGLLIPLTTINDPLNAANEANVNPVAQPAGAPTKLAAQSSDQISYIFPLLSILTSLPFLPTQIILPEKYSQAIIASR